MNGTQDAEVLLEVARRNTPEIVRDIKKDTVSSEMMRLGSTGCNSLYARKYMTSIHPDQDRSKAITAQLLRNTKPDEYHFIYATWGFLVVTEVGTVW